MAVGRDHQHRDCVSAQLALQCQRCFFGSEQSLDTLVDRKYVTRLIAMGSASAQEHALGRLHQTHRCWLVKAVRTLCQTDVNRLAGSNMLSKEVLTQAFRRKTREFILQSCIVAAQ